ncbi:MAG: hypothetical protein GY750_10875 [Lentisphaerae bacterium]|nr:hypothetical protein [Lentisphaerota bacterium]MCP4101914.1 hypothetical protein [Lentisphaerota bacterium]
MRRSSSVLALLLVAVMGIYGLRDAFHPLFHKACVQCNEHFYESHSEHFSHTHLESTDFEDNQLTAPHVCPICNSFAGKIFYSFLEIHNFYIFPVEAGPTTVETGVRSFLFQPPARAPPVC